MESPKIDKLFEIVGRLFADETVNDAQQLSALIVKAAQIAERAGQRIMGIESRDLSLTGDVTLVLQAYAQTVHAPNKDSD